MPHRYAIYYAPSIDSAIWRLAAKWLGRDAAGGEELPQPEIEGFDAEEFYRMTAAPRRYGFHATLKPPMRLVKDTDAASLRDAVEGFVSAQPPLPIGRLTIGELGQFNALVPAEQNPLLTGFAGRCVDEFERFRAPLTSEEHAKRRDAGLTSHQRQMLDTYGYPYVFEEFRMHLTLSGELEEGVRAQVKAAAEEWFAPVLVQDFLLDRLSIYEQDDADAPFIRRTDHLFSGQNPTDSE